MRGWICVAVVAVMAATACTRDNPSFGDQEADSSVGGTSSGAGSGTSGSSGTTTDMPPSSTSGTTTSTATDSGIEPGTESSGGAIDDWGRCEDLLFALTQDPLAGLLMIDLKDYRIEIVKSDVGGVAVGTDPVNGNVYGWPFDPTLPGFELFPGPPLSGGLLPLFERPPTLGADLDPGGKVWLLVDQGGPGLSELSLDQQVVENRASLPLEGFSGDVVIDGDFAVVFAGDRDVTVVHLGELLPSDPVKVNGMAEPHLVSGAAIAGGRYWVTTFVEESPDDSSLWQVGTVNDLSSFQVIGAPVTYGERFTDLAPVYGHDDECEAYRELFD